MKRAQKQQADMLKKEKFQRQHFPQLLPMNQKQADFLEALKYSTIVVADGSSGTGKTLISCWHAAKKLHFGDVKKVVLIRAYQPLAGRSIGYLPGEVLDKLLPYYQQLIDYFEDYLGKGTTDIHIKHGTIEICPLETIRGRSWSDSIIIVDESQNLFIPEMQALVTRIGDNSQMIFCGDDSGFQTDVRNSMNGLTYLKQLVQRYNIEDISFVKFGKEDIVRSGITRSFVVAFEEEAELAKEGKAIYTERKTR